LALGVLAVALAVYFRSYRVWPMLPAIFCATLTLGFGILAWALDRFKGTADVEPRL
jgi:hypothetical protein